MEVSLLLEGGFGSLECFLGCSWVSSPESPLPFSPFLSCSLTLLLSFALSLLLSCSLCLILLFDLLSVLLSYSHSLFLSFSFSVFSVFFCIFLSLCLTFFTLFLFWLKPFPLENVDDVSPLAVVVDPLGETSAGRQVDEHMV